MACLTYCKSILIFACLRSNYFRYIPDHSIVACGTLRKNAVASSRSKVLEIFSARRKRFVAGSISSVLIVISLTEGNNQVWIDVLLSAGVSVDRCVVLEIFEEDYLSLSDVGSPSKSRASPSKKRTKQSPKKSESDESDVESEEKKRHKSRKVPTPIPSPPVGGEPVDRKQKRHSSKNVSDSDDEKRDKKPKKKKTTCSKSESGQTKGKDQEPKKSGKTKKTKRPVPISKTSGSTIILSD